MECTGLLFTNADFPVDRVRVLNQGNLMNEPTVSVERITKLADIPGAGYECLLGAKVLKRSRANTLVEIRFRASPTGPWFVQQHKVPNVHVLETKTVLE